MQFKAAIEDNWIIARDYRGLSDSEENTLSLEVKEISGDCLGVIKAVVLRVSNIISSLF